MIPLAPRAGTASGLTAVPVFQRAFRRARLPTALRLLIAFLGTRLEDTWKSIPANASCWPAEMLGQAAHAWSSGRAFSSRRIAVAPLLSTTAAMRASGPPGPALPPVRRRERGSCLVFR